MPELPDEKRMRLRYAGVCRVCGASLEARVEAIYERSTKTVRCTTCSPTQAVEVRAKRASKPLDPVETPAVEVRAERASKLRDAVGAEPIEAGTPGASARREFERRQAKREARIREKHRKLGGLILAMSDDPQYSWSGPRPPEQRR